MTDPTDVPPPSEADRTDREAAQATWRVKPAGRYALIRTAGWWVVAVVAVVAAFLLEGLVGPGIGPWLRWIGLAAALVAAVIGLWKYVGITAISYELADGQLRTGHGVLSRETEHLELYRVRDIGERRPFPLRLIGLGEVVLHTEDRSQPVQRLVGVTGSHRLAMDIRRSVEACRGKRGYVGLE